MFRICITNENLNHYLLLASLSWNKNLSYCEKNRKCRYSHQQNN